MKRTWVIVLALAAFVVGLVAPATAASIVTPWVVVQQNPGENCTIGHAGINNTTDKAASTVRSKQTCSNSSANANLFAGYMGAKAEATDDGFGICASSTGWLTNANATAERSVATTVYCTGPVAAWGYQRRRTLTSWSTPALEITDYLNF